MTATLDEERTVTFDSTGTATVPVGPGITGVQWHVTSVRLVTTSVTLKSRGSVYFGSVTASPLGATFSGDGDTAGTDIVLWSGQPVTAQWTGGDIGATARVRVAGEIRTPADGYLPSRALITQPFNNAVTVAAAASPLSLVGTQIFDSGVLNFATLNAPIQGPIDVSQWPTSHIHTDPSTAQRFGIAWYNDLAMTQLIRASGGLTDNQLFDFTYPNAGPYLRLTSTQNAAVAAQLRWTVNGSRFTTADLRQLFITDSTYNFNSIALNIAAAGTNTLTSLQRFYGTAAYMVSSDATAWRAKLYMLDLAGAETLVVDRHTATAAGQLNKTLEIPLGRLRLDLTNNGAGAANFWVSLLPYTQ